VTGMVTLTSGCSKAMMRLQCLQLPHHPAGSSHIQAAAADRAAVSLPVPAGPTKSQA